MTSLTRTPGCTTKGCPAPKDPDWHKPWCGGIHECFGDATHQHVPKRSQGGKEIVACLCAGAHDEVDNGYKWGNGVFPDGDGKRHYFLWDVAKGVENPLIDRVIGEAESAAAEAGKLAAGGYVLTAQAQGNAPGEKHQPQRAQTPSDALSLVPNNSETSAAASPASPKSSAGEAGAPALSAHCATSGPSSPAEPLALPGTITPTSLTLPQNLSYEKWAKAGETLGDIHRASRFWIGDWLTFGEDTFGEKVAQAMEATGLEFETLANIASVCRKVPASRRRESLSFRHHTEVAAQEPERQESLLAEAEKQGWSVRLLREAARGLPQTPPPVYRCPKCGHSDDREAFKVDSKGTGSR